MYSRDEDDIPNRSQEAGPLHVTMLRRMSALELCVGTSGLKFQNELHIHCGG
jgi:hypothetical protein